MFDSSLLLQYGSLGLFTLYLIYDKQVLQQKMVDSIDNNTVATNNLVSVVEMIKKT